MMAAIFCTYMLLIWLVFSKFKLIRLSFPIALFLAAVGPVFAFFILLSMNNYHPSSSDARVFQRVVQIVPHITTPGRVAEILVQPNTPIKKGDVIFRIDPQPFQFEVDRLQAALSAALQDVPQLKSSLDQASAGAEKATAQYELAKTDLQRQQELFARQVVAQAALDRAQRNAESAEQAVAEAKAAESRARFAFQSNIGSDNTAVAQVRQQLAAATYNLNESVVRAPCDGYAVNMQLVPGAIVSAAASVLPFVCDRDDANLGIVVASFMQGPYLQIAPGEYAEVIFPMYPGRVFPGKVVTTVDVASQGQLTASGLFPGSANAGTSRFAVRIRLDDAKELRLPAGAQGDAAVYSGNVQIAGVIRMALMRMTSWTNYLHFTS